MSVGEITAERSQRRASSGVLVAFGLGLAALAAVALMAERLWLAAVQPLWFDEAWSLAVATAPDWRSVIHEARVDVNAPLGYLLLHAWTMLAGSSDFALRLPGLLAVLAAALLSLAWPARGLRREARLAWAAMIFAWWGVDAFLAGRAYGLLLALTTAQTLAFAALLERPGLKRALTWSGLAALAILTHYYALILAGVQGLAYLALCRRGALRTWPAALAFAPAFGWLAWHAPRLAAFAAPGVAWHARVGPGEALALTAATLDPSAPLLGLVAAAVVLAAAMGPRGPGDPAARTLRIAAAVSFAALALTLLSGALHPSLTGRYLVPTVPGLLLGLVLAAQQASRPRLLLAALAALWLATALRPDDFARGLAGRGSYGFETASRVLMRHGATDVVFAWDHEATAIMPPATLQRLGSVFFRRAGYPVRVRPLIIRPSDDVNRAAPSAAAGARPGRIWIYNRQGRTAARAHPPAIPQTDPRWSCERIGDDLAGSLACWRAP